MPRKKIHPNYEAVYDGIKEAFRELRKHGLVARMDYMCCGSCASFGLAKDAPIAMGRLDPIDAIPPWVIKSCPFFNSRDCPAHI